MTKEAFLTELLEYVRVEDYRGASRFAAEAFPALERSLTQEESQALLLGPLRALGDILALGDIEPDDEARYDPNQPRDKDGKWTSGGGGALRGYGAGVNPDDVFGAEIPPPKKPGEAAIGRHIQAMRDLGYSPETVVENIRAARAAATPEQIEAGKRWYPEANELAMELADRHGITPRQAIGAIAACSTQTPWDDEGKKVGNKTMAELTIKAALDPKNANADLEQLAANICQGLVNNKMKTLKMIRDGVDPAEYTADGLGSGPKTRNFANNIADPLDARGTKRVTIDTWAFQSAFWKDDTGKTLKERVRDPEDPLTKKALEKVTGKQGVYDLVEDSFVAVSTEFGDESPAATQAITWLSQQENFPFAWRSLWLAEMEVRAMFEDEERFPWPDPVPAWTGVVPEVWPQWVVDIALGRVEADLDSAPTDVVRWVTAYSLVIYIDVTPDADATLEELFAAYGLRPEDLEIEQRALPEGVDPRAVERLREEIETA